MRVVLTPSSSRLRRWRRRAAFAAVAVAVVLTALVVLFQAAVRWLALPAVMQRPLPASTLIDDCSGTRIAAFADARGEWSIPLPAEQISPYLPQAIVATEDARFYQHAGVDWRSALAAMADDAISLRFRRGASTIPMQLLRLRDPAPRSLVNKLMQAIGGEQLVRRLGRQQILVQYLNCAPFGGNIVGVGAASWRYFNLPCRDLSLAQAALLAGIPQNPNRFRPDRFPQLARARRDHVLNRMLACGMITAARRDAAAAEPLRLQPPSLPQDDAIGLLPTLIDLAAAHPSEHLRLTIDLTLQRRANAAAMAALAQLAPSHVTAAAVVVLDTRTAECLAAVSATTDSSHAARLVDLTCRPHSSGSTLKPFIYAAAFDAGICTPGTVLQDAPTAWADYQPKDYDRDFVGPITAADALAQSRNLPALRLLNKVGLPRATEVMSGMGLATLARTPDRPGLSLAVGGASVTPIELAEAYATLARGGVHREVTMLTDLAPAEGPASLPRRFCLQALQCLADPARTRATYPPAAALAPAWKTGTSSGHRDAWCAAVTPRRTVVVWLGNADGSGSPQLVGQETAAPLALQILCQCDSGGPGFAPAPDGDSAPAPPARPTQSTLAITSPANQQQIILDPALPAAQQRLALRAEQGGSGQTQLWWFIDGTAIGQCDVASPLFWPPSPGPHTATATTADGTEAETRFTVR